MAYIPYSPEIGCKYWLTGPDGTVATFNDPTDANYVGMLTDVSGLDSANVRESGDDMVNTDGGWHGNFWYGRRPITMAGMVFGHSSSDARTARLDRLRRATNAMRSDAILSWLPNATGSVMMRTPVRRQQPLRITGNWVKNFQISLVSEFAPLFSDALYSTTQQQNLYPNIRFETTTPLWQTSNATPTFDAAQFWEGTKSLKLTATGGGPFSVFNSDPALPYDGNTISPNVSYRVAMRVRANTTTRPWKMDVNWYDFTNTLIRTDSSVYANDAAGAWTTLSNTVTAPSNAYAYQVVFATQTTPAAGEIHWLDGIEFVESVGYSTFNNGTAVPSMSLENKGDVPSYPVFTIVKDWTNSIATSFTLVNSTSGQGLIVANAFASLPHAQGLEIDTFNHTVTYRETDIGSGFAWLNPVNAANRVDFVGSTWPTINPGLNTLTFTGTNISGMKMKVAWRDCWA